MNAVEYGHQRHALKEERAKEMAEIEAEIADFESKKAELAAVFANIQQQITCLKAAVKAKYLDRARSYEKYMLRLQELEAQFVASKVKPQKHTIMTREEYEHMRHAIKVEHARTESKFAIKREELKALRVQLTTEMVDVKRQLSDLGRKQVAEIAVYHERLSALLKEYEANKEVEPSATQEP